MTYLENGLFIGTLQTTVTKLAYEKTPIGKARQIALLAPQNLLLNLYGTVYVETRRLQDDIDVTYLTGPGVGYLLSPSKTVQETLTREIGVEYFPLIQAALRKLVESQE